MKNLTKIFLSLLVSIFVFSNNSIKSEAENQEEIDLMIETLCKEKDICPELIKSMVFYESSYQTDAYNNGHIGLMQINPKWHKDRIERLEVEDLYNAEENLKTGIDYVNELFLKYNDPVLVLMAYNCGEEQGKDLYYDGIVSNYAKKILRKSCELEEVLDNGTKISSFG